MSAQLMLLPYLQAWDGQHLALRLLAAPQSSPLDPLAAGEPTFTAADFSFEVRLVSGLGVIPTLNTGFTPITISLPAPAQATDICKALELTLPIDHSIGPVNPRAGGAKFLKYAPPGYRDATGYSSSRNPYVVTDDSYHCAVRAEIPTGTRLTADPPKLSWGKVLAMALRQPLLAQAIGLVRLLQVDPPAHFYDEGGWLYVSLTAGSPGASLLSTPDALKLYAARVPPLKAARSLFTSVLFPVAAIPPAASYDALFREVMEYDDGFAKTVYASQPQQLDPLAEEADDSRPAHDLGIQLGWDDEQIANWLNRQIDPAAASQDAPMGVIGYRIDGRLAGEANWHSLVLGTTELLVDTINLGSHSGEFYVEIAPNKLIGDTSGAYWMPIYFADWRGPSLVGPNVVALSLEGTVPASVVTGTDPDLSLRYGESYEFRVRFVDHTGGGPALTDTPRNPSPQPIGAQQFKRWVRPQALRIETRPPIIPDPANPPTSLAIRRPHLGYPAYVYADGSAADLLADRPQAALENRAVGLPDPDVTLLEIEVQVDFPGADGNFVTLYRTTRPFPADPDGVLTLTFDWQDMPDALTLIAPTSGAIILPTSRAVRLNLAALAGDKPNYYGEVDVQSGPTTSVSLYQPAADERSLYLPFTPSEAIQGIFLQPNLPVDMAVALAQQAAGKALAAPDNALGRLAAALDLEEYGLGLRARRDHRILFGCSPALRHIIGPDGASLRFAALGDLTQVWLVVLRVSLDRDWSWDGLDYLAVERDGVEIGRLASRRTVGSEALTDTQHDRVQLMFLDALDPKPPAGQFPQELEPTYRLMPQFRSAPAQTDADLEFALHLPITTPPAQIPRLVSVGLALSPYQRAADYSSTEVRQRLLWLEFESEPDDPHDRYFARVLAATPDPVLLRPDDGLAETTEPPLPIDPEPIRIVVPGQSDDGAGHGAMQALFPTDSPRHFLLPLPPGLTQTSPELFGFFTYELRVAHEVGWSTAQGRYSRPLHVNGVQHPTPPLTCTVQRDQHGLEINAPFANPVSEGQSLLPFPPITQLWVLIYAQVYQADGADRRNILLGQKQAALRSNRWEIRKQRVRVEYGTATWSNVEISDQLELLTLGSDTPLSCLVVETLPGDQPIPNPVSTGLGYERFLRTSPLTPIPEICC